MDTAFRNADALASNNFWAHEDATTQPFARVPHSFSPRTMEPNALEPDMPYLDASEKLPFASFAASPVGHQLLEHGSCLDWLEHALLVGAEELHALKTGHVDIAETNFAVRKVLISRAWEQRDSVDNDLMRDMFVRLTELQNALTCAAQELQNTMRHDMRHTQKETKRLSAYQKNVHMG